MTHDRLQASSNMCRTFGFAVLRQFFDARALAAEVDEALRHGAINATSARNGASFRYVPMMTAETPASLSLLDSIEPIAAAILGGSVVPTRAKAVRYVGSTGWHADSDAPVVSMGVLAYLEPLRSDTGALRLIAGSHHPEFADAIRACHSSGQGAWNWPAYVAETTPGDLIVMDERVWHASLGGGTRKQWRVDYLPVPQTPEAEVHTRAYFANLYAPIDRLSYDAARYPSYGRHWTESGRPAVERLRALGVYELASAHDPGTRCPGSR